MSIATVGPIDGSLAPDAAAPPPMSGGIALSGALHAGLIALILFGLPNLFRHAPPQDTPIAVQLVTIAPETRATHPNPYRPKAEAKPLPEPAPPAPKPEPKPAPPPPSAEPPSAAAPPAPPPLPEPKPAAKAPPAPPPPPPKPVIAKAPPPPPEPKPKPEPKPEPKAAQVAPRAERPKVDTAAFDKMIRTLEEHHPDKHPQPVAFDALLKNLTREQVAQADDAPPAPPREASAAAPSSQPKAPLGSQLTASQIDLLREQIERCWDIPAGARDAQDLNIEIKAVVGRDGTVQQAAIVDTGRYATDPFFRAAADSAKRALLNPQCSPLPLPPDKFEAWHNLDLTFNPKDLL